MLTNSILERLNIHIDEISQNPSLHITLNQEIAFYQSTVQNSPPDLCWLCKRGTRASFLLHFHFLFL